MNINLILKDFFRLVGLEVKRYNFLNAEKPLLKKLIKDFDIQTVIDVGANEGQYALQLFKNGFGGEIYSFEPIDEPYRVLQKRSEGRPQWHACHSAIGSRTQEVVINVSENLVSSSIFEVVDTSLTAEPSSRTARKENVRVTCLDTFFDEKATLKKEVLLKLDVQGFELEALKGGVQTLKKCKIIQSELSLVPLYKGSPLIVDVIGFLQGQGYEIFTIIPGFRDAQTGRLLQVDGIFLKR